MMRSNQATLILRLTGLSFAVLMVAACTPTTDQSQAPASQIPADQASTGQASTGQAPEPTEPSPNATAAAKQGPLDEFTMRVTGMFVGETGQDIAAREDARHRREQEFIAACMAKQGFTYLPIIRAPVTVQMSEHPPLGSREFVETYGFGLVAFQGTPASHQIFLNESYDPNRELITTMSESELAAFNAALFGEIWPWFYVPPGVPDPNWGREWFWPPIDADNLANNFGCWGRADIETQGLWTSISDHPTNNPSFAALEDEVNRFPDSIAINPLTIALNTEYAVCMAAAGFPGLTSPEQTFLGLQDEYLMLLRADDVPWVTDAAGISSPNPDPDGRFSAREFEIALIDLECREQISYDARLRAIEHQLQQEFVDANRNELEAWATFAESLRANH